MSTFVEITDVEKKCKVIVNLDLVTQIAPLVSGGCHIFYANDSKPIKTSNSYEQFAQFAIQPVTVDDIKTRIDKLTKK